MKVFTIIETYMGEEPLVYLFFSAEDQLDNNVKEEAINHIAYLVCDREQLTGDDLEIKLEDVASHFDSNRYFETGDYCYYLQEDYFENV